jgi:hypothetical protein
VEPRGIEPKGSCANQQLSQLLPTETSAGTDPASGNVRQLTSDKSDPNGFADDWAELAELGLRGRGEPSDRVLRNPQDTPSPLAAATEPVATEAPTAWEDPVGNLTRAIVQATSAGQWTLASLLGEQLLQLRMKVRTFA